MIEIIERLNETHPTHYPLGAPSNDNQSRLLSIGLSNFPENAVARIYKPARSAMTSGKARSKHWRLVFERRTAPFIEPLMGYTGGGDTLTQVELSFPTLESAIRYAERQGLAYVVQQTASQSRKTRSPTAREATAGKGRPTRAFSKATLDRLGLSDVEGSYGDALDGASDRDEPSGPETWSGPMDVVHDPALCLEAKRSILMNWAWTEYLIDQATNEGMPENRRPSRLGEVEQALLALERGVAADQNDRGVNKAA